MNKLIDAIDQEVPVWAEDAYERGFSYGLELAMHIIENMDGVAVERCEACPHYHAYVNAKQGRGLCDHFMHEMPEDGYCSEHGKGDENGK